MTIWNIEYIAAGSGQNHRIDRVTITDKDEFEFETGTERATNIIEVIQLFEIIAAKYWGTYETKNAITKIETVQA